MILESYSGGGTQLAELISCSKQLTEVHEITPDLTAGVSAGAITAALKAIVINEGKQLWSEIEPMAKSYNHDSFFDVAPVNNKGSIRLRALWRLLRNLAFNGQRHRIHSLGVQNIRKVLGKIITKERYERWKTSPEGMPVYVVAVDLDRLEAVAWNLKESYSYGDYMDKIAASSAIPFMTQPIMIDGRFYYDGGLLYHNPSALIMDKVHGITKCISTYSRPEKISYLHSEAYRKNMIGILTRSTQCTALGVSVGNVFEENEVAAKKGIQLKRIFLPESLEHTYDVNPESLQRLWDSAIESTAYYMQKKWTTY